MPSNPKVRALASEAARKIKTLTETHESQIALVYQQFREQAANIQGSNADELHTHSVTPAQSAGSQQEQ